MRSYNASESRLNSLHQALVDARRFGRGQQAQHVLDGFLDQENAGGFERLEKSAGEAERHAVALPGLRAPPGAELQHARLTLRAAIERGQQGGARLVFADELRREHVAVARAVLQRDAPDPAALAAPWSACRA